MKHLLFILSFYLFSNSLISQSDLVDNTTGINVDVNVNGEIIYIHTIKDNHTLYSLSKLFKITVDNLMEINSISENQTIALDSEIKIPLSKEHIITSVKKHEAQWVPLNYNVKKSENLYKLSHLYFPQKIENLVDRNNVSGFALKQNQNLIIGYWNPTSITYTFVEKEKPKRPKFFFKKIQTQNKVYFEKIVAPTSPPKQYLPLLEIDTTFIHNPIESPLISSKGIAIWEKSWTDDGNLYVLHNYAKKKSMITLRNPVVGLEVQAQVIGSIPEGIYTEDVDLIINPAVAKKLGALDSRLRIEMDYYE